MVSAQGLSALAGILRDPVNSQEPDYPVEFWEMDIICQVVYPRTEIFTQLLTTLKKPESAAT